VLKAWMGLGALEPRAEIFVLLQGQSWPWSRKKETLPVDWFVYYQVSGPEVGLADTEEAVVLQVVSWLETVLNEPQCEEMIQVVAECLKKYPRYSL
jgi:hypothetical protein